MVLETAQLLCSPYTQGDAPYRRTHYNHPCAKWARESIQNYRWLIEFGMTLAAEKKHRFGTHHKSREVIQWCEANEPVLPDIPMTQFPQAMPDEYKHEDVVTAYRQYYLGEKQHIFKWTKRNTPKFILDVTSK